MIQVIFIPLIVAREKVVENAKNGKHLETTTGTRKDDKNPRSNLAQISCIQYLIAFRKKSVLAFLNSGSEVNAIYPTFAKKLGLSI